MSGALSPEQIRDVNTRYHDIAAEGYDAKWGIDFGAVGAGQVLGKLRKALGERPGAWQDSLEIGAGTGYFTLNMLSAGLVARATCSDISAGMLATLGANARRLGLEVRTRVADAERLPFEDGSFDLVFGHAVLHHIPDLPRAFAEFARVLRPGGTLLFAGEPSRYGDRVAALPKRAAAALAPGWRLLMRARAARSDGEHDHGVDHGVAVNGGRRPAAARGGHALEGVVDVHAFAPAELAAFARGGGFVDVRVVGEELLANLFGWANRTLEATAEPASVPWLWRQYAYRGYLLLQEVDRRVLESRLPPAIFYNLMLCARRR